MIIYTCICVYLLYVFIWILLPKSQIAMYPKMGAAKPILLPELREGIPSLGFLILLTLRLSIGALKRIPSRYVSKFGAQTSFFPHNS